MDGALQTDIRNLVEKSRDAVVCSVDDEGFPNAKAMFVMRNKEPSVFWFSTNTSAIRTAQFEKCPKACIYFMNPKKFQGLMITGTMRVCTDAETKQSFWHAGDEQYYPLGPTDPDYCILRFAPDQCNYYHGLQKQLFSYTDIAW